MDTQITDHFADLIALAQTTFEQVDYVTDITPKRAILRFNAKYGSCRVFVTELFSDGLRKYRYYVLRGDWVEAGFDNSPDARAIRLKSGKIGKEHAGEQIPHLHQEDKSKLSLTEEMSFAAFVDWVTANIQPMTH
ncbi:MAG: hypothetical protein DRR08_02855 [Candidatus Parabeggiatoa sp. nov. 2]|nr:MAG: hypothetical protein B6247_14580 [Beggiatoa sp. 4572_84]RKZ63605.1 MAG: hypothetical protein DRR08_02855 [Gammaproteobacteria bacterium]HEC84808.1 hypothetical protein [Thioploca sp.]